MTKTTAPAAPVAALITDKAQFDAACASVAKRGAKLDADIQHLALSAISHLDEHKNPHFVNKLYLSLQAGARKSALAEWFLKYGKVAANTAAGKKELPFLLDKERTTDMAGGRLEPWFLCKPDAAPDEVFDIVAALRAVLKKAAAKNKDEMHMAKLENFVNDLAHANTEATGGA